MFAKAKSCIRAGLPKQGLGPKAKEGNPPQKNNELVILRKQKRGELCAFLTFLLLPEVFPLYYCVPNFTCNNGHMKLASEYILGISRMNNYRMFY